VITKIKADVKPNQVSYLSLYMQGQEECKGTGSRDCNGQIVGNVG